MLNFTFSEGFAISAGLIQAFVAVVFARFRLVRPEWGLGWLAMSFAMAAAINVCAPVLLASAVTVLRATPGGAPFTTESPVMAVLGMVLGVSAMGALVAGAVQYVGQLVGRGWWLFFGVWGVYLFMIGVGFWLQLGAMPASTLTAVIFVLLSACFLRTMRREPGAGHGVAALMISLYVPLLAGGYAMGLDPGQSRHWAAVPYALAGLGIMSATMGRLRAELHEFNATLEARVSDRTRELQEIATGLESFNGMVSHDLRGPLGGIHGLTEQAVNALKRGDTDRALRLMDAVHQESGHLTGLVGDLLSLARVNHAELQPCAVPMEALLLEAERILEVSHGAGYCEYVIHGSLPTLMVDPGLIRQVLVNLLSNAVKFSRKVPSPRVLVSSVAQDNGVVIQVQDNGVGFDAAQAGELFAPFKRLHGSAGFEGSGVGLTIVRRIIERHGGRIWAESTPGLGARFSFWLPETTPGVDIQLR
jgi:signal transduction histidine kinase